MVLWSGGEPWQFSLLFVISGLAGMLSLHFVRKIPDIEIGEQAKSSGQPVPWLEILEISSFYQVVDFQCGLQLGGRWTGRVCHRLSGGEGRIHRRTGSGR